MEQLLLELDVGSPNIEQLNAIFRAAHSIKGGAATFGCFTHHAPARNLLDAIRRGEMALRTDMVDIFLETKDVLKANWTPTGPPKSPTKPYSSASARY